MDIESVRMQTVVNIYSSSKLCSVFELSNRKLTIGNKENISFPICVYQFHLWTKEIISMESILVFSYHKNFCDFCDFHFISQIFTAFPFPSTFVVATLIIIADNFGWQKKKQQASTHVTQIRQIWRLNSIWFAWVIRACFFFFLTNILPIIIITFTFCFRHFQVCITHNPFYFWIR